MNSTRERGLSMLLAVVATACGARSALWENDSGEPNGAPPSERPSSPPVAPPIADSDSLAPTDIAFDAFAVGVTTDDILVYKRVPRFPAVATTFSLEAIDLGGRLPFARGPIVIARDLPLTSTTIVMMGGVVGFWTNGCGGAYGCLGTFHYWSSVSGVQRDVAQSSITGVFAGSDDGTRIMFTRNAHALATEGMSADVAFAKTTSPNTAPLLTGANAMRFAAMACTADGRISGGHDLALVYCRMGSTNDVAPEGAELVRVRDDGTVSMLDNGLSSYFHDTTHGSGSLADDRVLLFTTGEEVREARLVDLTSGFVTSLRSAFDGALAAKGAFAITSDGAERFGLDGVPPTLVSSSATEIITRTADLSRFLLWTPPDTLSVATPNGVIDVVTQTNIDHGTEHPCFTHDGAYVVYASTPSDAPDSDVLFAVPSVGGKKRTLLRFENNLSWQFPLPIAKSSVLVGKRVRTLDSKVTVFELWYANAESGTVGPVTKTTALYSNMVTWRGDHLFYTDFDASASRWILRTVRVP